MGGVDLMDSLLARHRILLGSKKWYFKIFFHLIDMAMVNAWLLSRRVHGDGLTLFSQSLELKLQKFFSKRTKSFLQVEVDVQVLYLFQWSKGDPKYSYPLEM
uniref:PiggyBac transposable element-derived protein domain-containing protein n=1 Tax=Cacopsylla melanoneura TaxID=428564 RepID=A0A8D8VY63_9HEMI